MGDLEAWPSITWTVLSGPVCQTLFLVGQ